MLAAAPKGRLDSDEFEDPIARFARCLPYYVRCTDDLSAGLGWAPRDLALRQREIAPDPEGWRVALRFDVDCPCEGQPHLKLRHCPLAATIWQQVGLPEPSFTVVNPANGHAHHVYQLRGWLQIDGADASQLKAVRYYAAVERAYTKVLRADPGYAGLVVHNPLSSRYKAMPGAKKPYSLRELASYVTLAPTPRRREPEIRCIGRNVEVFDRPPVLGVRGRRRVALRRAARVDGPRRATRADDRGDRQRGVRGRLARVSR